MSRMDTAKCDKCGKLGRMEPAVLSAFAGLPPGWKCIMVTHPSQNYDFCDTCAPAILSFFEKEIGNG